MAAAAEHRLEGVLAKRLDSRYRPGLRTDDWLKIKNVNRQELVIGGWLPGKGARAGRLGALLMGYYEPGGQPEGKSGHGSRSLVLRYAGRVGTGFDERELERLAGELAARARDTSPFTGTQPPRESRFVEPRARGRDRVSTVDARSHPAPLRLQGTARGQAAAEGTAGDPRPG